MRHSNRELKAATHHMTEAVGEMRDDAGAAVHAAGDTVRAATHQARDAAGRVVKAVQEKFDHGRDRVKGWENDFEGVVRSRPLSALLVAGGIGFVVGLLCHRRRV